MSSSTHDRLARCGFARAIDSEPSAERDLVLTSFARPQLRQRPQRGTRYVGTWSALVQFASSPILALDKASAGGFVLADLRDGIRSKAHVERVSALSVDYDAGEISAERVHRALGRYKHVVYTTASHAPNAPRWRLILALSRPTSVDEHAALYTHLGRVLALRRILLDPNARDACRLWYAPTVRPEARFECHANDGTLVDVDAVSALARVARPERQHERSRGGVGARSLNDKYLSAALRRAAATVASAPRGHRNATLNREAFALARLPITATAIEASLREAATAAGLGRTESELTIASALRARRGLP